MPHAAFRLANGLTVVHAAHRGPIAAIEVWINAGAADEPLAHPGVAHAVEHLLFRATRRGGLVGAIERTGGAVNAWTAFDHTVVHAAVPRDALAGALAAIGGALLHPRIDPDELARERGVIAAEHARLAAEPDRAAAHALFRQLFLVHPYRRPVIGTSASIAALGAHAVETFYRAWYVAAGTVVVVAADAEPAAVAAWAAHAFGALPARPVVRAPRAEPAQRALRVAVEPGPHRGGTRLALGARTGGAADPDRAALELVAALVGRGTIGRALAERGLAGLAAAHHVLRDAGALVVAGAARVRAAEVAQALARGLARLAGVSDAEVSAARAVLEVEDARRAETAQGVARSIGMVAAELDVARLAGADVAAAITAHARALRDRRAAVTADGVRAMACHRLVADRLAVVAVGGRRVSADRIEAAVRAPSRLLTPSKRSPEASARRGVVPAVHS